MRRGGGRARGWVGAGAHCAASAAIICSAMKDATVKVTGMVYVSSMVVVMNSPWVRTKPLTDLFPTTITCRGRAWADM